MIFFLPPCGGIYCFCTLGINMLCVANIFPGLSSYFFNKHLKFLYWQKYQSLKIVSGFLSWLERLSQLLQLQKYIFYAFCRVSFFFLAFKSLIHLEFIDIRNKEGTPHFSPKWAYGCPHSACRMMPPFSEPGAGVPLGFLPCSLLLPLTPLIPSSAAPPAAPLLLTSSCN